MGRRQTAPLVAVFLFSWVAFLYTFGLGTLPPRWEEPRRCIVAFEMVTNHDYVVPTCYGEVYAKKPPLQNWLIALIAGFDTARIEVGIIRWLSVGSCFLVAIMLWVLERRRRARWPGLA